MNANITGYPTEPTDLHDANPPAVKNTIDQGKTETDKLMEAAFAKAASAVLPELQRQHAIFMKEVEEANAGYRPHPKDKPITIGYQPAKAHDGPIICPPPPKGLNPLVDRKCLYYNENNDVVTRDGTVVEEHKPTPMHIYDPRRGTTVSELIELLSKEDLKAIVMVYNDGFSEWNNIAGIESREDIRKCYLNLPPEGIAMIGIEEGDKRNID